jgi:hypothetical protein
MSIVCYEGYGEEKKHNRFAVQRYSDKFKFKYIMFKSINNEINESNIYDELKDGTFTLKIGSNIIYVLSYGFLMNLNKIIVINDKFIITIPEYFVDEIYLISLCLNEVVVLSDTSSENIINDEIVIELSYLDTIKREELKYKESLHTYQGINESKLNFKDNKLSKSVIYPGRQIKGFFIEYDIKKIDRFLISINGCDLFEPHDNTLLQLISHKINDNMFYVPINNDKTYSDNKINSYLGSINNEIIGKVEISVVLHEKSEEEMTISALELGIYRIYNGECELIPSSRMNNANMQLLSKWKIVYLFEIEEYLCSLSNKKSRESYTECKKCNKKFNYNAFMTHIRTSCDCPKCKEIWSDSDKIKYELRN